MEADDRPIFRRVVFGAVSKIGITRMLEVIGERCRVGG